MRFTRIVLQNFRPYYGKNAVEFKLNSDKNIMVVVGKNGHGKTSFLRAIQWVFFGSRPRERYGFFNRKARNEKKALCRVELSFEHEGQDYTLSRRLEPSRYPVESRTQISEQASLYRDSVPVDEGEIPKIIDDILPEQASQFFFFDGERIISYTDPEDWERIQSAIECVLGIPTVRQGVDDLDKVHAELETDYNKCLDSVEKFGKLGEERKALTDEIDRKREEIREKKDELKDLKGRKRNLEVDMRQFETMATLLNDRDELKEEKDKLEQKEEDLLNQKLELTEDLHLIALNDEIESAFSKSRQIEKTYRDVQEEISEIQGKIALLQHLKEKDKCLCGQPIDDVAINLIDNVIGEMEKQLRKTNCAAESGDYRGLKLEFASKLHSLEEKSKRKTKDLIEVETGIFKTRDAIHEVSARIESIESRIDEDAKQRVPQIAEQIEDLGNEITSLKEGISYLEGEIGQLGKRVEHIDKEIRSSKHASPDLDLYDRAKDLAQRAKSSFSDIVEWMAHDKREDIERLATEVHHSVTNKPDSWKGVKIGTDFRMDIIDVNGDPVPKKEISEGEKQILAFSFIAALAKAAKAENPIVMDSPIIRLDEEHRLQLIDYLPNLAHQVILFMIPKTEMRDEYLRQPALRNHLGHMVEIQFDKEEQVSTLEVI